MNQAALIDTPTDLEHAMSAREHQPAVLWAAILALAIVLCGALAVAAPPSSDANALVVLFGQAGMFP